MSEARLTSDPVLWSPPLWLTMQKPYYITLYCWLNYNKSNQFISLLIDTPHVTSVTAVLELCYIQANNLFTGLICSLSKLKQPHVNTLIGLEGIKNVHMQLNCPLI